MIIGSGLGFYQRKYNDYNSKLIVDQPAKYNYADTSTDKDLKKSALEIAAGRIAQYDTKNSSGEKDGKISFDEYLTEQRHNLSVSAGGDSLNEQEIQIMKEDFNMLDIDGDGFLSDKEIANEILTMDSLGNKDGTITKNEYFALWEGEDNTPQRITQLLRNNFPKYFSK